MDWEWQTWSSLGVLPEQPADALAARIEAEHLVKDGRDHYWRACCPNCALEHLIEENEALREWRRLVLANIERIEFRVGEIAVADPF